MVKPVPNQRLKASRIPDPDAEWDEIGQFALTFNGYEHWGSFEACAEIARERRQSTLTELRTCLFFEQRSWRHAGYDPSPEAMRYIKHLLEQIRWRVQLANDLLE